MAYFQHQTGDRENTYARQFPSARPQEEEDWEEYDEEPLFDDGFDEMMAEEYPADPEEELSEEEQQAEKRRKYRFAANLSDLAATLIGVGVILALVALLISMIRFVSTDFSQNFSLLQSR